MEKLFSVLEETINKAAINEFKCFIAKFHDVTKWFICSDYCLDDKDKPNDVITFVIFPYIFDFPTWLDFVKHLQKTDLKNCRTISKEFCTFSHSGLVFSFNFMIDKKSIVKKWKDKTTLHKSIDDFINLINKHWIFTTPHMIEYYNKLVKKLKYLKSEMNKKSFNYKLLSQIFLITFLASYLKYLLYRETDYIEVFSWLSDRGKMTGFCDGVYGTLFEIISYCLCANHLPEFKYKYVKECLPAGNDMFYDEVNRVADFICGGIASYDLVSKVVNQEKHCTLVEDVIADNPNIQILRIGKMNVSRIIHRKL